ncbi:ABC transporter ATP-binding protein [Thermus altitudinis]|uniref:ABC transporter ATP-binding protein n=1 Tax=Thermus altitudinis TaxID=2908145 RepID=UPI001FAAC4B6
MLEAHNLGYRVGGRWLLKGLHLSIAPGEVLGILGPNGSGKTTLLRLLAGEIPLSEGEILLEGRPLAVYRPSALARTRAVLSQLQEMGFPFTAYEVAFLGRLPHLEGRREKTEDHAKTLRYLERVQALPLKERLLPTLSGGERMRVEMARLLNQEAKLYLLDEPTNHLDPRYAMDLLQLFRSLAQEGAGVVAVLHDLNLACRFADRLLLLKGGRMVAQGRPEEVLQPNLLQEAYEVAFQAWEDPSGTRVILPLTATRG